MNIQSNTEIKKLYNTLQIPKEFKNSPKPYTTHKLFEKCGLTTHIQTTVCDTATLVDNPIAVEHARISRPIIPHNEK